MLNHSTRLVAVVLSCIVCIVALFDHQADASEFSHRLPADGTWCKYHVDTKIAGIESSGVWSISSVGRKTLNEEPCRWIELRQLSSDEQDTIRVIKVLVAESAFGPGKNPVDEVREIWIKSADAEPVQAENLPYFERFALMAVEGPIEDVQQLADKQTIDWQRGRLECAVFTGKSRIESKADGLNAKLTHRVLVHDSVPFRTAGSTVHFDIQVFGRDVTADAEFSFVDSGTNAQSVLPDVK